jgi:hypothetical protein
VLRDAGFTVAISQSMDAWLKTHAVFLTAVCGGLYCAGGDNYQLARSTKILALFADGVREGLRLLRTLGFPPAPLNLLAEALRLRARSVLLRRTRTSGLGRDENAFRGGSGSA